MLERYEGFNRLYWESSYAIVLTLMEVYPTVDLDSVGLMQLRDWIVALPNFADDPDLANDVILTGILREWYEEANAE
jgi:FeS assembly protein IscX